MICSAEFSKFSRGEPHPNRSRFVSCRHVEHYCQGTTFRMLSECLHFCEKRHCCQAARWPGRSHRPDLGLIVETQEARIPTSKGAVARFIQNSGEQVRAVIHKSAWQPNPSVLAKPASQQKPNRSSQSPCGRSFGGRFLLNRLRECAFPPLGGNCLSERRRGELSLCVIPKVKKKCRNNCKPNAVAGWPGFDSGTTENLNRECPTLSRFSKGVTMSPDLTGPFVL